jgi:hypothetical protein
MIRDRSIRVPPSLLVTSISVDGDGIGQYGMEVRRSRVDITGVLLSLSAAAGLWR